MEFWPDWYPNLHAAFDWPRFRTRHLHGSFWPHTAGFNRMDLETTVSTEVFDVYRETEGQALEVSQGVADYLQDTIRRSPVRTLDTLVLGLTSYPFLNKWSGFDPWNPTLGIWLSWASIMGLVLFVGSATGRLLLLVLGTSLLPYAFTWKLIADWRFTEHAYPFLLIASFLAISRVVTGATRWRTS